MSKLSRVVSQIVEDGSRLREPVGNLRQHRESFLGAVYAPDGRSKGKWPLWFIGTHMAELPGYDLQQFPLFQRTVDTSADDKDSGERPHIWLDLLKLFAGFEW